MSISTTTRLAGPFTGNGVQQDFPFAFKVFTTADVLAVMADADGVETTMVLTTDYVVTLNADQNNSPGGNLQTVVPLPNGYTLVMTSQVEPLQPVDVTNGGGFFPAVFNGVFDRLTILVQQLSERLDRTMIVPLTSAGVSLEVPVSAGAILQWNGDGSALVAQALPDLALSLALPDQAGHAGQAFFTDGTNADWRAIAMSDVTGLVSALNYCSASAGQAVLQFTQLAARTSSLESKANFALNAAVIF